MGIADINVSNECEREMNIIDRRIDNLERQLALLTDPHAVHMNILRGTLPITKEQLIHAAGLPANIEEQIAEARKAAEWISVKDRLPEKSIMHDFLVWCKCDNKVGGCVELAAFGDFSYVNMYDEPSEDEDDDGEVQASGWHREEDSHGGEWDSVMIDLNDKVTHWMPKPKPPINPPAPEDPSK